MSLYDQVRTRVKELGEKLKEGKIVIIDSEDGETLYVNNCLEKWKEKNFLEEDYKKFIEYLKLEISTLK